MKLKEQASSLVKGQFVDTLFFLGEEVPMGRLKSDVVLLLTVLVFDELLLSPLILGAL